MDVSEEVRAAGGVVWRPGIPDAGGMAQRPNAVEVLLVHRPAYDDWSLPKGKLAPGEADGAGALREVREETGLRCSLGGIVGTVRYRDRFDRPKTVVYFEMRPRAVGAFVPGDEVDRIAWMPLAQAVAKLSYPHDRELLRGFEPRPASATMYLVRHADAGSRRRWNGPDPLRPLTAAGSLQAEALVRLLDGEPLVRLVSSQFVRCVETLEPLAVARGLAIETAGDLGEGTPIGRALTVIEGLAGEAAALCSHGDVIEGAIRALAKGGMAIDGEPGFAKGSAWALRAEGGRIAAARYLPSG